MKAVTEKQIEAKLKQIIEKTFLGLCFKLVSPMFNGVPDRIILLPSARIFFIELKRPKSGELSPIQRYVHKMFRKLGFEVFTIWSFEELEAFISYITTGDNTLL
jgi:hypothetical protein